MGVDNLNAVIANMPLAAPEVETVIVDFSNLVILLMMRHIGGLPRTSAITCGEYTASTDKIEIVEMDYYDQVTYIVDRSMNDIRELYRSVKDRFPSFKRLVLVTDPVEAYVYRYEWSRETQMSCVDRDMFAEWVKRKGFTYGESIHLTFNSKEDERKRRREATKEHYPVITITRNGEPVQTISSYDFHWNDEPEQLLRLLMVLKQGTRLCSPLRAFELTSLIHQAILDWLPADVDFLMSDSEADICIKALFDERYRDRTTLIISSDTDYAILFGECRNAYISTNISTNAFKLTIRHPYSYWRSVFGELHIRHMRMLLARLSALLGNDYTLHKHEAMCNPDTINLFCNLFATSGTPDDEYILLNGVGVKKNRQLLTKARSYWAKSDCKKDETLDDRMQRSFKHVDRMMLESDTFIGYFETLLIYANYTHYGGCVDMKTKRDSKLPEERSTEVVKRHFDRRLNLSMLNRDRWCSMV